MPAAPPAVPAPRTFWSGEALAAAVDEVFAEALAEELTTALNDPGRAARPAIVLPDTDTLITQAGIVTGPCPPDPPAPSALEDRLHTAAGLGKQAAWLLLKYTLLTLTSPLWLGLRLLVHALASPPPPALAPSPEQQQALKAAEFLELTSQYIHERGWTQHTLSSHRGVCVIGAERDLIRARAASRTTARDANTHLQAVIGTAYIPWWNDRFRRTEAQVHQALLTAAERARAAAQ
ncbi:hypothetical protein ABT390_33945 [Streptomyces aurantiacus]|uniref:Uncharacterized protein n=1 Tax=Streptomyces aurantiacus JA 4570 TaxID=1286094 RepID=S3ZVS5_9ACTN|nr:hypothetical protein [Streptomyces aurantiacus]EPH46879.1 hypothetical protein STRAU_0045 [Streptomyces aurantiacus JA 4570]